MKEYPNGDDVAKSPMMDACWEGTRRGALRGQYIGIFVAEIR